MHILNWNQLSEQLQDKCLEKLFSKAQQIKLIFDVYCNVTGELQCKFLYAICQGFHIFPIQSQTQTVNLKSNFCIIIPQKRCAVYLCK
jgi:hypothetical protein